MSQKPRRTLGDFATLPTGALLRVYARRYREGDAHGYCKAHPGCQWCKLGYRRYVCGVIVRPALPAGYAAVAGPTPRSMAQALREGAAS